MRERDSQKIVLFSQHCRSAVRMFDVSVSICMSTPIDYACATYLCVQTYCAYIRASFTASSVLTYLLSSSLLVLRLAAWLQRDRTSAVLGSDKSRAQANMTIATQICRAGVAASSQVSPTKGSRSTTNHLHACMWPQLVHTHSLMNTECIFIIYFYLCTYVCMYACVYVCMSEVMTSAAMMGSI